MKKIHEIRQGLTDLVAASPAAGGGARPAHRYVHLWRFCARRLHDNNVMAMSAALSFRTIFALIPTIIVAFLAMKSLGVVEDSKRMLRDFLDRTGLTQITYVERSAPGEAAPEQPDAAGGPEITVAEKVESLVDKVESQLTVGRLGPVTGIVLVWTALTLLTTVERSLNRIFGAPRPRSLARRILTYWSAVTLGPLALALVSRVGGDVFAAGRNVPVLEWTLGPLGWIMPVAVGILLLAGLYTVMPNTQVRFLAALEGAALAVPVWLAVKWGFSMYVDHVGRHSLYGAMGLIPLFLMWLNVSWWIFLLGAEVSYVAANLPRLLRAEQDGDRPITPWHHLAGALVVARAQLAAGGPVEAGDVAKALGLPSGPAETVMVRLCELGVLVRVAGDGPVRCVLALPASRIPVAEVLRTDRLAAGEAPAAGDPEIAAMVADVRRRSEAGVAGLTVADLVEPSGGRNLGRCGS